MHDPRLAANIASLQSKLRQVPQYERNAYHQIAVRHAGDAVMFNDRGADDVALDKFNIAVDAAQRGGVLVLR